ncbi:MAG: 2-oxoacid:acceptor oxidoreductase family protein [Proteobacteria bacterium]|nr:2-oxoacid:acceptor oxidoreductase family protein [Pseudomonadota bacterium]
MERQQVAISGLGGQGVLFLTRLLAETALAMGRDVLSSETHGMAMRGGAVISHLKVGPFDSPLIRDGQADLALYLAEENLQVHPGLIGRKTTVLVNSDRPDPHDGLDAGRLAEEAVGRRQAENLVLLGYALGRGHLFAETDRVLETLKRLSRTPAAFETNAKALAVGLDRSGRD